MLCGAGEEREPGCIKESTGKKKILLLRRKGGGTPLVAPLRTPKREASVKHNQEHRSGGVLALKTGNREGALRGKDRISEGERAG